MKIGNRIFETKKHTYIMGILNVTPDSFSDGGKWSTMEAAQKQVAEMIAQGADIIDIGGESTRPGYTQLTAAEEISRVVPVIQMVKRKFDIPVSIDTCKSQVAQAAIAVGADMVNDIWGLKYDPAMAAVIAKEKVACCLMHNRERADYERFMPEVLNDLAMTLQLARAAQIAEEAIMLDPGVGFGKSYQNNLEVIARLEQLQELGFPVLLGTSRKSVIGQTLDLPVGERVEGTVATTVIAVMKGAAFVRVHDIKENYRAIKMAAAILGREV